MPRTRHVIWLYTCDYMTADGYPGCINTELEVTKGEHVETGRGTVVHDQADADAVARQQGWTIGRHVLCPICTQGGRS